MSESNYIIAEIGVNHNGEMHIAKKLIDAASVAGIDAVKFQTYKTEKLVHKLTEKAPYQNENDNNENQFKMLKNYEFTLDQFKNLYEYCQTRGIEFLTTAFDIESVEELMSNIPLTKMKVSSSDLNNYPLLHSLCKHNLQIILSTGMADIKDIQDSVNFIERNGGNIYAILQCTTSYPCPINEVNVGVLKQLKRLFKYKIGFSDHSFGSEAAIIAATLGAEVFEKHITLDRKSIGPDHAASMEVTDLKAHVDSIRNVKTYLGEYEKKPTKTEQINRDFAIKKIITKEMIFKNQTIVEEKLDLLRVTGGIEVKHIYSVIGKRAKRDVPSGTVLNWDDIYD